MFNNVEVPEASCGNNYLTKFVDRDEGETSNGELHRHQIAKMFTVILDDVVYLSNKSHNCAQIRYIIKIKL